MILLLVIALACSVLSLGLALASLIGPDPLESDRRR